jgi:leucyl-tRNA synthetase
LFPDIRQEPMTSDHDSFDIQAIESRWRTRWRADRLWDVDVDLLSEDDKFYNLVEFPYPSAEGLHVGHAYTYCGADTMGRYLRMRGKKVFQPIGFDSFGIHTENFALRTGRHPKTLTARTIANYRRQLDHMGIAWNWNHEIVTSDPEYYRWTQWIFLKLYESGLAVREEASVVWCPTCLTVLAHEQLEGERCERCHTLVTERVMKQWFLRITAYADALLDGLDDLRWPPLAKELQRDWIGRSFGIDVDFHAPDCDMVLTAFSTRPETIFGVTFLAVSPAHPAAHTLSDSDGVPRADGFSGVHAINPATQQRVPIYVADYVVSEYGTGVVMGVPAHDERDHRFALERHLPIKPVIRPAEPNDGRLPWTGRGILADSGAFTGQRSSEAADAIASWLEELGSGRRVTRYRMHDWLISRQRYWGPPIPILYCEQCGTVPVPEDQLPVLLPEVDDIRPTGTAASPLARIESFVNATCPVCSGPAKRETDVSDTFLDSAWYYLRYPSSDRNDVPWDPQRTRRLLPVDLYAGGREHVMRHHLYARFVARALHSLGCIDFEEPFPNLCLHGLLIKDGAKMSKSRGNVVVPDDYVAQVGADNLRMYLLFCGTWTEGGDFRDDGLAGMVRFYRRVWRLITSEHKPGAGGVDLKTLDKTISRVQDGIENLKFNTAIASLMELVRWTSKEKPAMAVEEWGRVSKAIVLLLAPFAPHLAEELWCRLGQEYSVHLKAWPAIDESLLEEDFVTLIVQVDGKKRDVFSVPADLNEQSAVMRALERENVRRCLGSRRPRSVVYIPNRVVNLVL